MGFLLFYFYFNRFVCVVRLTLWHLIKLFRERRARGGKKMLSLFQRLLAHTFRPSGFLLLLLFLSPCFLFFTARCLKWFTKEKPFDRSLQSSLVANFAVRVPVNFEWVVVGRSFPSVQFETKTCSINLWISAAHHAPPPRKRLLSTRGVRTAHPTPWNGSFWWSRSPASSIF